MSKRRSKKFWIVTSSLTIVALTATGGSAWALNRFVIPHVEITDVAAYEAEQSAVDTVSSVIEEVTETSAVTSDASIQISTVVTGSGASTVTYYVADVTLTDATALRSAFANNQFGENVTEKTSTIAAANDALFAINGDYYGFRSTGIVIRNGVVYRDSGARQGLAFYRDGHVEVYDETATTAQALVDAGVWNTLSFGPALLEDGEVVDGIDQVEVDTNFGNHSIQGDQPRTAVGVIDDNHLVFVVVDGRSTGYSAGVDMNELAQIMKNLGCETAYNLDGGGSSTMYFNGSLVNNPLGKGQERGTSDILYIGS